MKKSTKFIRMSVTLLLLIAMLLTPMSPIFAVVIDGSGDTELTAADIVSEDASKREQFSRHYLTGDGTYFAVSYAEQVNYQDEDGNWIPVDNSLSTNVLTGEKSTKNDKFKVKFANKANKDDLVSIQTEDYKVSFGITVSEDGENYLSLSKVKGTESASNTSAEPKTTQEATSLGKAVSGITYESAFSDYLDVRYTVAHEKVKEDIILQKKSDFTSYKVTYNIKEKDALATLNEDGSITFTTPDGALLFNVGAPVMYDSDGKSSADIAVSITQTQKTVEVTYTPSADWLNDEERVYPVTIDPEMSSSDCFYETVLCYSSEPYEIWLNSTENIATIYEDQSYYLWLTAPTLPRGMNVLGVDFVLTITDYSLTDVISVDRIGSIWFPGEMIYPDGSNAIPSELDSFSVGVYGSVYDDSDVYRVTINVPDDNIYEAGGYSNYFGNSYCGHKFTGINGAFLNIYASGYSETSYRPCIILRYSYEAISNIQSGSMYYIKHASTGKYISVEHDDLAQEGTNIYASLEDFGDNNFKQIFIVTIDTFDNTYSISLLLTSPNNYYLSCSNELPSEDAFLNNTWYYSYIKTDVYNWGIECNGYNVYSMRSYINPEAALSINSDNVVLTEYSENDLNQLWMFEFVSGTSEPSPESDRTTAILMTVKDYNGESFHGYAHSVEDSLNYNTAIENISSLNEPCYTINDVVGYLSQARIMVISAHGWSNSILLVDEEIGRKLYAPHVQEMDLSHIEILFLLCCSTALNSNTYSYTNSNTVITPSDVDSSNPNIFEVFVQCGVKTVVGFNDSIGVSEADAFIAEFFKIMCDSPSGSNTSNETPNYSVKDTIEKMSDLRNTNYQLYSGLLSKLVIGGSDNTKIYQVEE